MSSVSSFKHVLIAVDNGERADKVIRMALRPGLAARATALMVVKDYGVRELAAATFGPGPGPAHLQERMRSTARRLLDRALAVSMPPGCAVARWVSVGDEPWREIVEFAQREGCDLIVMASHGRGELAAALLGSETAKVLSQSEVPVLVVR